jgi:hypothetical protein
MKNKLILLGALLVAVGCSALQSQQSPAIPTGNHVAKSASTTYQGCPLYDNDAFPVITSDTVDPESATILADLLPSETSLNGADDGVLETVNTVSSASPAPEVSVSPNPSTQSGHKGPFTKNPVTKLGGKGTTWMPWFLGKSLIEGGCSADCGKTDGHAVVLDQDDCYVFEAGGMNALPSPNPTSLTAYDGFVDSMESNYLSQTADKQDNTQVSGIPIYGTTAYEDDSIGHPIAVLVPTNELAQGNPSPYTNYATGFGDGGGTCGTSTNYKNCFWLGDVIRKKAGPCPADYYESTICYDLQTYGGYVTDTESNGQGPALRMGLAANGGSDWPAWAYTYISAQNLQTGYDVMTRGTIMPSGLHLSHPLKIKTK